MSAVSNEKIFAVVVKHLVDVVEEIDPDSVRREHSMKDLGAGSLDIVEVVSCSMRELRVRVPRKELGTLRNIGELVDLLERVVTEKSEQESCPEGV